MIRLQYLYQVYPDGKYSNDTNNSLTLFTFLSK